MSGRKIAFVEFPPSGGLFQFTFQLGEALASDGDDVHLVTGWAPERRDSTSGLVVHPVLPTWHPGDPIRASRGAGRLVRRAWRAARLLAAWLVLVPRLVRMQPDVLLWSAWRFGMDAGFVVLLDMVLPRTTHGIIAHEPVAFKPTDSQFGKSGLLFDRLLTAAWRRMDIVFVLGSQARENVLRRWAPRAPVMLIPHGDEGMLRRPDPMPAADETKPMALFFGTWTSYKGIDDLLEAFALVRDRLPEASLVLAGAVTDEIDFSAISARASTLGGVELRPGYVPAERVQDLIADARLVVTPYRRASQSGVAHLAHTFGRPVVANDVGDISSVVRDGVTGYLATPGRVDELADRICRLLEDPALAKQLGDAGHEVLTTSSSWSTVATRVREGLGAVEG